MAVNVPRHKGAFGKLIIRHQTPCGDYRAGHNLTKGGGAYRTLRRLDARRCLSTTTRNQPFAHFARCNSMYTGGRDGSVGISTRYWMDVPGIEHWLERDPSRTAPRPTQPPAQWQDPVFISCHRLTQSYRLFFMSMV